MRQVTSLLLNLFLVSYPLFLKMIIFLYGSDGYRLKENVDIIVGSYQKKHKSGVNLYRFSIEDGKRYDELDSAPKSVSFFDEAKLIIVKNVFDNRTHSQTFPI